MGCVTSFLAVTATAPNSVISSRSGAFRSTNHNENGSQNRPNIRRQTAATRSSTATTSTVSSRASTSNTTTISAKDSKLGLNSVGPSAKSERIFTISGSAVISESSSVMNHQNHHRTNPAVFEQITKPQTIINSQSETARKASIIGNAQKPNASSITRIKSDLNNNSSTNQTNSRQRNQTTNGLNKPAAQKNFRDFIKSSAPNAKQSKPLPSQWKSAQSATLPLGSATSTTASSSSSSTNPSSCLSTASDSQQNNEFVDQNTKQLKTTHSNRDQDNPISIEQLLGIRLDSAKLQKILDRKKSLASNSLNSSTNDAENENPQTNFRKTSIANTPSAITAKGRNTTVESRRRRTTTTSTVSKPTALKNIIQPSKAMSSNTSTNASWEFSFDTTDHRLYRKVLDHPTREIPTTRQDHSPPQQTTVVPKESVPSFNGPTTQSFTRNKELRVNAFLELQKEFQERLNNEQHQQSEFHREPINKANANNTHYDDASQIAKSQHSIQSDLSATSYPMTQDYATSRYSVSSINTSHDPTTGPARRQSHVRRLTESSVNEDFPAEQNSQYSSTRMQNRFRSYNPNRHQSDSLNNRYSASTSTASTTHSSSNHSNSTKVYTRRKSRHHSYSELDQSLLPEYQVPKLEIISQTSFESELQRKYSEISQRFVSRQPPEPIQLPPLPSQRRQSDHARQPAHRLSLADRRRSLRKAQTMPNLVFDERDELLKEPLEEGRSTSPGTSFANNSSTISKTKQENVLLLDVPRSKSHSRPTTPHLPLPTLSTGASPKLLPYQAPSTTATSSSANHAALQLPLQNHNPYLRSKSPSLSSSTKMSNRFESLLRHKSFLKTAASTVGSTLVGLNSRRESELSMFGVHHSSAKVIQVISDHATGVNCLELSEDRSLLVSGGEDGVLRLWSTFSSPCECIGVLVGHESYITCCAVYRLMIISGSADRTIKLWSIEDGNCLMTLVGHTAFINRVVCAGPLLLSTSFDGTVRIWTLTERLTMIHHLKNENGSLELEEELYDEKDEQEREGQDEFASKWKSRTGTGSLVNRQTIRTTFGGCLHILKGHQKSVTQVGIVATDPNLLESGIIQELDIVVSTSTDGTARTWSLTTGELRHILNGHTGPINCMAMDPKETQFVYTAGADWTIKCWDVITGEHLRDLKGHQQPVLCLMSHNRILYSGSADNTVRAWAMEFGQCTRIYYRNTSSITCIQYFKGIVYTGSNDHSARLYDSNSGVLKQTFTGHSNSISALKVVQGKLFTASFDGRILVWDCEELQREVETNGSSLTGGPAGHLQHSRSSSKSGLSGAAGAARSTSLVPSSKQQSSHKPSMYIGASLMNHTLELFPSGSNAGRQHHPREELYPQLAEATTRVNLDSTDAAVSGLIENVLVGKKKKNRLRSSSNSKSNHHHHDKTSDRRRQSTTSKRRDSSSSSSANTSCFGARIWPERLLHRLSTSTSSSASGLKTHSRGKCWSDHKGA